MSQNDFFKVEIAGLVIVIEHKHGYVRELCRGFEPASVNLPHIAVSANESELLAEKGRYEIEHSEEYCESVCLYRAIAERLPHFDAFVFHGAAVEIDGRGFIFTAPSGTGKTTHISLLLRNYPENVSIINGDKPVIRYFRDDGSAGGEWRVCSTPWAGKEDMKVNRTVPLCGIVLLCRAEENRIEHTVPESSLEELLMQVYFPYGGEEQLLTLELLDKMSKQISFYRLECNMKPEAAEVSYNMLKK